MGFETTVYIGAFLRVPGIQKNSKIAKMGNRDLGNISEKFLDELCTAEFGYGADKFESIWTPNQRDLTIGFNMREEQPATSLVNVSSNEAIAAFTKKYQHIIDLIESNFDVKTVVDWGVFSYAS